jgi:membrane-associated phospholipid phosphatase
MAESSSSASARLVLAGGLAFLLSFSVLTALVRWDVLTGPDVYARTLILELRRPFLQPLMESASYLGGSPGQIPVVLLGAAVLWRRQRRWALALPLLMAGAGLAQLLGKWAMDRSRPNLDPWGYPSAHTLSLVVLLGFFAFLIAGSSAPSRWRAAGVTACGATVGVVAYSRLYLDAHWLSDVLGGMSAGIGYLLIGLWLTQSLGMWLHARPEAEAARAGGGAPHPADERPSDPFLPAPAG